MSLTEFSFAYNKNNKRFTEISSLKNFKATKKEKNSIKNLINYFSEDKMYKRLSNSFILKIFLLILFLFNTIILSIIYFEQKNISEKIKQIHLNNKIIFEKDIYLAICLGMIFLFYFILVIFLFTYEIIKKNLFYKLSKQEKKLLFLFSKKFKKKFVFTRNHKRMKIFFLKCFNVFEFEFKILLREEEKDLEKTSLLENQKNLSNSDVSFLSFDEEFNDSFGF